MDLIRNALDKLDILLDGIPSWQIIVLTLVAVKVWPYIWNPPFIRLGRRTWESFLGKALKYLRTNVPFIANKVEEEIADVVKSMDESAEKRSAAIPCTKVLPEKGIPASETTARMDELFGCGMGTNQSPS